MQTEDLGETNAGGEPGDELTRLASICRAELKVLREENNSLRRRRMLSEARNGRTQVDGTYLDASNSRECLPLAQRQRPLRSGEPAFWKSP
jgi:hypothetical protein